MPDLSLIGGFIGGVGLFLLGMGLMTDGLKLAAGPALEHVLANSTRTRLRGLASGILITGLVQSSSAVTVATIGFVNAGLLNLSQALWVLFGANVGTTMTGWLVALVGLKFKIDALALPLIGVGMILRLSGEGGRRGAVGTALAGFGVLFLGIDMLKESFAGVSSDFSLPAGDGIADIVLQVGIGTVLTVLMQSSSAALVIALTAAQGGLITTQGAAAVVIGANIGTTVTALIAAIGATPNAKRAAAAHILFNLLTGTVALLLLPWLIGFLSVLRVWLGLDDAPAAQLALFHTVFNVLGVILIWPLASRLTRFLEARFKSTDEDEARPQHLDKTVLAIPALAIDALYREVRRMGVMALNAVTAAIDPAAAPALGRHKQIAARLNLSIADFVTQLHGTGMSAVTAQRLPDILRLARYYETATELAVEASAALGEITSKHGESSPEAIAFTDAGLSLLALVSPAGNINPDALDPAAQNLEICYHALKAQLLKAGAQAGLPVVVMDARLRAASAQHRALKQSLKAARMLASVSSPDDNAF